MWVQNNYSPASDSTYDYFAGGGNEAKCLNLNRVSCIVLTMIVHGSS